MKIRNGDRVIVTAGKDRGREGKVVESVSGYRVVVEGVNKYVRHIKRNLDQKYIRRVTL